jgi:hypothetical protein
MGFRTVVVLSNDRASEWENDPELGRKIFLAASMKQYGRDDDMARRTLPYGHIVEQVHADQQTLAIFDGYNGEAMCGTSWFRGQTDEQRNLECLKALAEKLGYRVSKLPTKKA